VTVMEILTAARAGGMVLEARGDRLHVEAPFGTLTPDLRAALVKCKPNLIAVLWRVQAMQQLAVEAPRPVVYARREASSGPGYCFSCGDSLGHPDAYGRCAPCDVASEMYYAARPEACHVEVAV
jgi:TubC N-terminal docking domain